ncbi:hypothetical protein [Alteromonas sp. KUL49]|uniref:hypothetical protein n=1 Tax=Alteromonas sp. KUL49 TaxID=2480798 RepID=UPI00102F0118|nr:hypothetical protein [Alteromonas sp. KUL49]TAP40266.1 hypothetical protein EYS00_08855 [Alteromonas sp. KUL49]
MENIKSVFISTKSFVLRYLWVVVFLGGVTLALDYFFELNTENNLVLLYIVPFFLFLVVCYFTAEITTDPSDDTKLRSLVRGVLALGYGFLIVVLCVAIWIMFVSTQNNDLESDNKQPSTNSFTPWVVLGCEYKSDRGENSKTIVPVTSPLDGENYCGDRTPQRLIVMGAILTGCSLTNTCPAAQLPQVSAEDLVDINKCTTGVSNNVAALLGLMGQGSALPESAKSLVNLCPEDSVLRDIRQRMVNTRDRIQALEIRQRHFEANYRPELTNLNKELKIYSFLDDLVSTRQRTLATFTEQTSLPNQLPAQLIVGGIVVPAYFVFCALLGAMIAMARKLPEFQARLVINCGDEAPAQKSFRGQNYSPLYPMDIPELVLFQMIQVVSAPILAILAYGYLSDDILSDFTAISVGFAAGFSSEWVLVMVRNITDRLAGATPKQPQNIAVTTPPVASQPPEVQLASGVAVIGSTLILRQDAETFTVGQLFLLTAIEGDMLTVKELNGSKTLVKEKNFFDLYSGMTDGDFVSLSPSGKLDG